MPNDAQGAAMISVVIAAHNEAQVIGRCLDALLADRTAGPVDIVVVANGCTDATAAVASTRPGVRVLDLPQPGKPGALNAGDAVAVGFPRVYLDADIVLAPGSLRDLAAAFDRPGILAAMPRREMDVSGRPLAVRAYYAVNSRLPLFRTALFGRGVIVLSEAGRARFARFPDVVADDLFLDSLFTEAEKQQVETVVSRVATPLRTADLIGRLTRVRAGNAALRHDSTTDTDTGTADSTQVRAAARSSWLRDVVLPRPWLAPAAVCYVGITLLAAARARRIRDRGTAVWARDESTRVGGA